MSNTRDERASKTELNSGRTDQWQTTLGTARRKQRQQGQAQALPLPAGKGVLKVCWGRALPGLRSSTDSSWWGASHFMGSWSFKSAQSLTSSIPTSTCSETKRQAARPILSKETAVLHYRITEKPTKKLESQQIHSSSRPTHPLSCQSVQASLLLWLWRKSTCCWENETQAHNAKHQGWRDGSLVSTSCVLRRAQGWSHVVAPSYL